MRHAVSDLDTESSINAALASIVRKKKDGKSGKKNTPIDTDRDLSQSLGPIVGKYLE